MRRLTFRQRQFLILLELIAIPLVVIMGAGLPSSRDYIIQRMTAQLETVAQLKTVQVGQWLNQGHEVARLLVNLDELQKDLPALLSSSDAEARALARANLYAEFRALTDVFLSARSASLLHPTSGRVLLSTNLAQEGRVRHDEDYFHEGQRGLYISPVVYSVGREAPVLHVSAPVHSETPLREGEGGELLAVVAVEMDLSDLQVTLDSRAGLGQTGRAYLVDADGFYVTLPPEAQGSPLHTAAGSEGVRRVLDGQNGSGIYLDSRGVRVLGVYRWLPEGKMGLLVEMEESELTSQVRRAWRLILSLCLGLLGLGLSAAHYLTNWLVIPLAEISRAAQSLRAGNLSHRAPAGGHALGRADEIDQLAAAFNEMADRLQLYYDNLEQLVEERTAELQTKTRQQVQLIETARHLTASLDLKKVLTRIGAGATEILEAYGCAIHLLEADGETLTPVVSIHPVDEAKILATPLEVGASMIDKIGQAVMARQGLIFNDAGVNPSAQQIPGSPLDEDECIIVAPFIVRDRVIGAMCLDRMALPFDEEDLALAETFATYAATALKNAQMYNELQREIESRKRAEEALCRAAATAERERLARELHDAVTQTLFSASLIADALPRVWERHPEQARRTLERFGQLTRGALAEMRTLLLELRPLALTEKSLGELLDHLTQAMSSRLQAPVTLTVEGEGPLPPDVQVALYRITQETLNNVAKHAAASQVSITLSYRPPALRTSSAPFDSAQGGRGGDGSTKLAKVEGGKAVVLRIRDDGRGFDPRDVLPDRLGLAIMRERAERIGATLEIKSQPGHGTQVEVVWRKDEGRTTKDEGGP